MTDAIFNADYNDVAKRLARRGRGRPADYMADFATSARKLCKWGANLSQLADFFGVSVKSIESWRVEHPAFGEALKLGREESDEWVVQSLYHRATGYSREAVKIFLHEGKPVYAPYTEHVPPDTTACIFWLKNRQPQDWRDKRDVEVKHGILGFEDPTAIVGAVKDQLGDVVAAKLLEMIEATADEADETPQLELQAESPAEDAPWCTMPSAPQR